MNNPFFNSIELINLLARWKKQLMIVGLASLVLSAVFSSPFFIKPKFKSTAIVYPSNLIAYSTESATEQMLQITQSTDIRDKMLSICMIITKSILLQICHFAQMSSEHMMKM